MAKAEYLDLFEELTGAKLLEGENYIRCPIHEGSGYNFAINTTKGLWECKRGCGAGNAWMLVSVLYDLSPMRAINWVDQYQQGRVYSGSVDDWLDLMRVRDLNEGRLALFVQDSDKLTTERWPMWWPERGFDAEDWRRWRLTMDASTGDVVIPVFDVEGHLVGEIRRRMPGIEPKYLYTRGLNKARVLFGSQLFQPDMEECVLVEGSLDAAWCWKYGHPALAVLGSSLSDHQVAVLRHLRIRRVTLAFDNDDTGKGATDKALKKLVGDFDVRVVNWRGIEAKDVAELPPSGLDLLLGQAVPAMNYMIGDF